MDDGEGQQRQRQRHVHEQPAVQDPMQPRLPNQLAFLLADVLEAGNGRMELRGTSARILAKRPSAKAGPASGWPAAGRSINGRISVV